MPELETAAHPARPPAECCIEVMPVYTSDHGGAILDTISLFNLHNLQALDGNRKPQQLGKALNILQAAEQKILPFLQLL